MTRYMWFWDNGMFDMCVSLRKKCTKKGVWVLNLPVVISSIPLNDNYVHLKVDKRKTYYLTKRNYNFLKFYFWLSDDDFVIKYKDYVPRC